MINAYVTDVGVTKIMLTPHVHALDEAISDEYVLRNSFLDQITYYADKKIRKEVVGVINSNSAKVTLFDDGSAIVYFWKTKKLLSVKWANV